MKSKTQFKCNLFLLKQALIQIVNDYPKKVKPQKSPDTLMSSAFVVLSIDIAYIVETEGYKWIRQNYEY
jgi:hypothetical protein